jgi:hypothetical protein
LIQSGSGSGSSIFPQSGSGSGSGSTKFLNPDPMRIRIHKGKFEDKFFFNVLKIHIIVKILVVCTISYLLAIKMFKRLRKSAFFSSFFLSMDPDPDSESGSGSTQIIESGSKQVIESGSTTLKKNSFPNRKT